MTQANILAQLGSTSGPTFRNRIINGAMVIDQRNAGASVSNINGIVYSVDRWLTQGSVASKFTAQQNAGSVTPPVGFANYLGITSSSAYSVSSGDYFSIGQKIEGYNIADLGWGTANAKTITVSFWVYSSLTGTFGAVIQNNTVNRTYPFTYSIPVANTWTQISVPVAGDTAGTWATTNSSGIFLQFGLGVGSTYSGTAGSWSSNNYVSATGATSVVGTNGATFYITGVQLEVGSSATGYEYRPYGTELALCQRYYETNGCNAPSQVESGSNSAWTSIQYQVPKRATPTIGFTANSIYYRQYGVNGYGPITSPSIISTYIAVDSAMLRVGTYSSFSSPGSVMFVSGTTGSNSTTDPFSISAEL